MRISELSKRSGVPTATIKYYLREGLLPRGLKSSPNQADYGNEHLHRLRLVRALVEVGGLPLATVREVVAGIEDGSRNMHDVLGLAQGALGPKPDHDEAGSIERARAEIDAFLADLGWTTAVSSPAHTELAFALNTLRRLEWDVDARVFERYARLVDELATWEFERTPMDRDREQVVEAVVVGTVVFEKALVALRRLAHESHSAQLFAENSSTE